MEYPCEVMVAAYCCEVTLPEDYAGASVELVNAATSLVVAHYLDQDFGTLNLLDCASEMTVVAVVMVTSMMANKAHSFELVKPFDSAVVVVAAAVCFGILELAYYAGDSVFYCCLNASEI